MPQFLMILKIIFFLLNIWKEKDTVRKQQKVEIGQEIVDAFKESDKTLRASRLNAAIVSINRLR